MQTHHQHLAKYKNWMVTSVRTADVSFTRMLRPAPCNESTDVGTYPYEILTLELGAFVRNGFVSPEFKHYKTDVVVVDGRYFTVGRSETGRHDNRKTWLSVSLPPELDPTPPLREWDAYASGSYLYDPVVTGNPENRPVFKVREVKP